MVASKIIYISLKDPIVNKKHIGKAYLLWGKSSLEMGKDLLNAAEDFTKCSESYP